MCRLTADTYSKSKYGSVIGQIGGWDWFQQLLQTLNKIAIKHNSTIANIAGIWVLDRPMVGGIIVGARNANHVQDHQAMFRVTLDSDDFASIDEVLALQVMPKGDIYTWERGGRW